MFNVKVVNEVCKFKSLKEKPGGGVSRGGHLEPKIETETRTKSNRTERFGFAILEWFWF